MVQNNLFSEEVQNGKQSQRTVKITPTPQPSNTNGRTNGQFRVPRQEDASSTNREMMTGSDDVRSQANQYGQVRLFGRIGRYFEVKHTQSGVLRATFSLATHQSFKNESGSWIRKTVWQRIVAWEDIARSVGDFLEKGARVSVEGKFKTREWIDRKNNPHTTTELVAHDVRFLDVVDA